MKIELSPDATSLIEKLIESIDNLAGALEGPNIGITISDEIAKLRRELS